MSDLPAGLQFVDNHVVETTYRICLYAESGEGKTLAAATAPGPILVVNADRPTAWAVARRRHPGKEIRETRFVDHTTLDEIPRYVQEHPEVATVVVDPVSNIYDQLVAAAPTVKDRSTGEMGPDYQLVNAKLLQFVQRMRRHDVHLVLVAHVKENDSGKRKDGKAYPRLGGMTVIRKLIAEMDIVGFVTHTQPTEEQPESVWFAQIQPTDSLIGKDGTDSLGERRVADLSRWVELAHAANVAAAPDVSDLPWSEGSAPGGGSGSTATGTESSPVSPDDADGGIPFTAEAARSSSVDGPAQVGDSPAPASPDVDAQLTALESVFGDVTEVAGA